MAKSRYTHKVGWEITSLNLFIHSSKEKIMNALKCETLTECT